MKKLLILLGVFSLTSVCSNAFADEYETVQLTTLQMPLSEDANDMDMENPRGRWAQMKDKWKNLRDELEATRDNPNTSAKLRDKINDTLKKMDKYKEKMEKKHEKWIKKRQEKIKDMQDKWKDFKENLDEIQTDENAPAPLKRSINSVEDQMKEINQKMEAWKIKSSK